MSYPLPLFKQENGNMVSQMAATKDEEVHLRAAGFVASGEGFLADPTVVTVEGGMFEVSIEVPQNVPGLTGEPVSEHQSTRKKK